ncbi:hypothetical protein EX30DRAFT_350866 [Ascodesmis nigricans]|uniref:Uncharacterized protein n=1 Tax=Ascodesmis nigricans TaxID=341454 RepID=A0A4S2MNC8_9PEZI|nr:hypothetical protein EX30DRAFT_350866 [Ascodesmis nigricans]
MSSYSSMHDNPPPPKSFPLLHPPSGSCLLGPITNYYGSKVSGSFGVAVPVCGSQGSKIGTVVVVSLLDSQVYTQSSEQSKLPNKTPRCSPQTIKPPSSPPQSPHRFLQRHSKGQHLQPIALIPLPPPLPQLHPHLHRTNRPPMSTESTSSSTYYSRSRDRSHPTPHHRHPAQQPPMSIMWPSVTHAARGIYSAAGLVGFGYRGTVRGMDVLDEGGNVVRRRMCGYPVDGRWNVGGWKTVRTSMFNESEEDHEEQEAPVRWVQNWTCDS